MKRTSYIQTGVGLLLWLLCVWLLPVGYIEKLVLFAFFVIVPLFLYVTERQYDTESRLFQWIMYLLLPMAVFGSLSFFFPSGGLAGVFSLGWVFVTCLIGLYGFLRFINRGFYYLEEFCIDVGYMYLPLGGLWFAAHRFGIDIGGFGSVIILLTVAHFHFSFLSAPIFTGLAGRMVKKSKLYQMMAIANVVCPMLVAVGITYSRALEMIAVILFVLSLFIYIVYSIHISFKVIKNIYARICLLISSFSLLVTITFAVCYGIGRGLGIQIVSIPEMVLIHGTGNAFGFVLFGLLAWGITQPKSLVRMRPFPHSSIKGEWRIGRDFLERNGWVKTSKASIKCLVDDFSIYKNDEFNPKRISPHIRSFYERTMDYELIASTKWQRGFGLLSRIYKQISNRLEQINLPLNGENEDQEMEGLIIPIDSKRDGRWNVRAWMRWDRGTRKTIFVAVYSHHRDENRTYMNIALPLPFGNMTGILTLHHDEEDGLILTSVPNDKQQGDEGIYYFLGKLRIRLPLNESFHICLKDKNDLQATHRMWMFGIPFLEINYKINKKFAS